jgi:undecaprenyl-diphosphatase
MLDSIHLLVNKGGKWSFPSNHAANSFVLATILSYFFSQWKYPLFILASLIGFSRIYVGVHYPGDVVFGALLGYCIAWILLSIWVILKMRELKRGRTWVWYTSDTINK